MDKKKLCRIRDVYRAIVALENQFQQSFNLNINEAMLLCTLKDNSGLTSGEIAEALGLTNSNASKVIGSAENKLLVNRNLDRVDKRQMHFSLTKKGSDLLNEMNCDDMPLPDILTDTCP